MSLGNRQYVGENDPVHPRDAIEAVPAAPLTSPAPMARISASARILVGIATGAGRHLGAKCAFYRPDLRLLGRRSECLEPFRRTSSVGGAPWSRRLCRRGPHPPHRSPHHFLVWPGSLAGAGLLAVMAGAWFVVGPLARPVLSTTGSYFVIASPLRELAFQIGYSTAGLADHNGRGVHSGMVGTAPAKQQSASERRIGRPGRERSRRREFSVRPRREPVAGRGSHL